jgi:ABC-type multidrug transport system fused ATPase/permease subunit
MLSNAVGRDERQIRDRGWLALTGLLGRFLRPYGWQVAIVAVLLAIQAVGILYLPNFNADIINNGVVKGDIGYIWHIGGFMIGDAVLLTVFAIAAVYRGAQVAMAAGAAMRSAIYRRVQAFSTREMSQLGVPSLITRSVNDVQQVQLFLQSALTLLILAVLMCVGGMIMAVREGPTLSILVAVVLPAMFVAVGVMVVALVPLSRSLQVQLDRINQVMREQITGIRVIRAFSRTRYEQDRFGQTNADLTHVSLRVYRVLAIVTPLLIGILNLACVGIVWFGSHLVSEGSMPIGNLTAFLIYITQVLMYVLVAVTVIALLPRAVASAERIVQVINVVPDITDPPRPATPASATGKVEFRQVSFGYPGSERPVLNELTLTLLPGQTSAVIGRTGSGKTTLVNLIPRLLMSTSGAVLVNDVDVREQDAEQLWSGIGLVPQAAFLFAGTVASNLRFGRPDATDEQLWHALDIAQAADFVASMPGQLEAVIDQGGTNVSGGQRQRLSIARALVREPRLYLLDDCFSALDAATDARLRAALRAEARDAAVLIVAQRVSTIMHADQIIVLDAGRAAGIGTHQQLLANCQPYQDIVASQLGEEAVA